MLFELIPQIISDVISIYLLVSGAFSSIESLMGNNSTIENSSSNLFPTAMKFLLETTTFFIILFAITTNSIQRNSVKIAYRIKENPLALQFKRSDLERIERLILIFKKDNEESYWFSSLYKGGFLILIRVDYPIGVIITTDRENLPFEFEIVGETSQYVEYVMPLNLTGERQLYTDILLRDDTSFRGGGNINIKAYMAFNKPSLRNILKLGIGSESINITT